MADNDITFNLTFDDVFRDRAQYIQRHSDIEHKSGVKKYATIDNFIDAQTQGITAGVLIPNNSVKFHITGTKFDDALTEITTHGKKKSHWMWYILPSEMSTKSATATFFKLGPGPSYQTTIKDYLNDDTLRNNYITMINAIYNYLYIHKTLSLDGLKNMFGDDYTHGKLQSSINNFKDILIQTLKNKKEPDAPITANITALHDILNPKTKT